MTDPNTYFGLPTIEQALATAAILRATYLTERSWWNQPVIVISSPRQRGADFVVTVYGDPPGVKGIETPRLDE